MLEFIKNLPYDKIITAAVLIVVCLAVIKIILFLFDKLVKKMKLNPLICKILRIAVKILLLFVSLIIVLGSFGISVSSLVAALSVVGVAFSLAIQGFLSNIFGGIQIISNNHSISVIMLMQAVNRGLYVKLVCFIQSSILPTKSLSEFPIVLLLIPI